MGMLQSSRWKEQKFWSLRKERKRKKQQENMRLASKNPGKSGENEANTLNYRKDLLVTGMLTTEAPVNPGSLRLTTSPEATAPFSAKAMPISAGDPAIAGGAVQIHS